jgi:hypothetical protein
VALYTQCEGGTAAQAYERFRFELGSRPELEDFWQQMAETDRNGHRNAAAKRRWRRVDGTGQRYLAARSTHCDHQGAEEMTMARSTIPAEWSRHLTPGFRATSTGMARPRSSSPYQIAAILQGKAVGGAGMAR